MNYKRSVLQTQKKIEQALFFLIIFFLPTQIGKHFWPQFSFIYSLKIDYLSPTLYLWDLCLIGLVIVWILSKPKLNTKALSLLLLFLLTQGLSLLGASNVLGGLVRLEQLFLTGFFGLYISSKKLVEIKKELVWGLGLSLSLVSVIAIFQFLKGGSLGLWILGERSFSLSTPSIATFNFYGNVYLRPYSTLPHPNVLAGFLVLSLALISWGIRGIRGNRRIRVLVLGLGVIATLLSFSRAGILVLLAEAFLYFRKKIKLLILLLLIPLPFLYVRFESVFNFDSLSILRREELNEVSIKLFWQNPLFGVGINNFINEITESFISGPSRFLQPVHNIGLLVLAESGLLGLLGILGLLGYPMFRLWKKKDEEFSKVLLFCFGSIFFLGMFDHYFLTLPTVQRLLFLIWGLSMLEYFNGSYKKSY